MLPPTPGRAASPVPPALDALLRDRLAVTDAPLVWSLLSGGRSNLSVLVTDGSTSWVLRRPPEGAILATAHDVGREYRIQHALWETDVPVPETYLYCEDLAILGAPFYVMGHVAGSIFRSAEDSGVLSAEQARAVSEDLVATLAHLHSVAPATVGLADVGRPAGFLERNLHRWVTQFEATRTAAYDDVPALVRALERMLPESPAPAVVHGDFRLDNVVLDVAGGGRVAAVLDWEMSTVGDPLTDLGLVIAYWDDLGREPNPLTHGQTAVPGFLRSDEVADVYARHREVDLERLDWYVAFGSFKVFAIVEGLLSRAYAGHSPDADLDELRSASAVFLARSLKAGRTLR
jgi:aminoglycoside phosphotransferase (APT) family kinase protein